jgi:hypothetical protein
MKKAIESIGVKTHVTGGPDGGSGGIIRVGG